MDLQKLFEALSHEEQKEMYHISRKKYLNDVTIIDFINKHESVLSRRTINCLKAICNYNKHIYPDDRRTKHLMSEIYNKEKPLSRQKIPNVRSYGEKTHKEVVKILVEKYGYKF